MVVQEADEQDLLAMAQPVTEVYAAASMAWQFRLESRSRFSAQPVLRDVRAAAFDAQRPVGGTGWPKFCCAAGVERFSAASAVSAVWWVVGWAQVTVSLHHKIVAHTKQQDNTPSPQVHTRGAALVLVPPSTDTHSSIPLAACEARRSPPPSPFLVWLFT
jgi:hypothetical protein